LMRSCGKRVVRHRRIKPCEWQHTLKSSQKST
jgi:hypothetical protein